MLFFHYKSIIYKSKPDLLNQSWWYPYWYPITKQLDSILNLIRPGFTCDTWHPNYTVKCEPAGCLSRLEMKYIKSTWWTSHISYCPSIPQFPPGYPLWSEKRHPLLECLLKCKCYQRDNHILSSLQMHVYHTRSTPIDSALNPLAVFTLSFEIHSAWWVDLSIWGLSSCESQEWWILDVTSGCT